MQKPVSIQNLLLVRKGDQLLLAMKKRGFGSGRWNGYGGKVQPGETVEESLVREVLEESGLALKSYRKVGFMKFELVDLRVEVHIFEAAEWEGEAVETEEMAPKWFDIKAIPFETMWASDPIWYPYYLSGRYFEGSIVFDADQKVVDSRMEGFGAQESEGDKK